MSAVGIGLPQIVAALAGIVPPAVADAADIETGFAYNALLMHGWPGVLVVRTAANDHACLSTMRVACSVHYCMRLGPNTANARGEDFEALWVNGQPPIPNRFQGQESVITGPSSTFIRLERDHPALHSRISSRIHDLVRSRWSSRMLVLGTPAAASCATAQPRF